MRRPGNTLLVLGWLVLAALAMRATALGVMLPRHPSGIEERAATRAEGQLGEHAHARFSRADDLARSDLRVPKT
jgi:hypothetical protein